MIPEDYNDLPINSVLFWRTSYTNGEGKKVFEITCYRIPKCNDGSEYVLSSHKFVKEKGYFSNKDKVDIVTTFYNNYIKDNIKDLKRK